MGLMKKIILVRVAFCFVVYYYLTSFDILKATLKCKSKPDVMKIYHVAQEL